MKNGVVKWFNGRRGYGFITDEESNKDIFVHYSDIQDDSDGYKMLYEGDKVEYNVIETEKGFQATEVNVTEQNKSTYDYRGLVY